tara:strand:- start:215 stop:682 length:468 start_codon:yes stop_codon:yes gene_type:complete
MKQTQTRADYSAQIYAFYIYGKRHIETIVKKDGLVAYQDKPISPEQYLQANPKASLMPLDEAVEQIQKINQAEYCKPWEEVSEQSWWDMFEILPPENYVNRGDWEMFRIQEYSTGNITAHYARIGKRYFFAERQTTASNSELLKELQETLNREAK